MAGGDENAVTKAKRLQVDERRRVKAIIERDRGDAARERMRKDAVLEVGKGSFVNLSDTVVEPTPEWLSKNETRPYTPRAPDGTARSVSTVRRVSSPIVRRLWGKGRLRDEQLAACERYRDSHEQAGLEGRWKTSHLSLAGNTGGGGGMGQAPMALHAYEAVAREEFRAARGWMRPFYLHFFDAVVLDDTPISRAWRFARCPKHKAEALFRDAAQELADFYERCGVELKISES
jgi:hypothetical protein